MVDTKFYDFINGANVQSPKDSQDEPDTEDNSLHGVRVILSPDKAAQTLLRDHLRMLSEMNSADSDK